MEGRECLCSDPARLSVNRIHSQKETTGMPAARDRFVNSRKAKGLLKGSGSVALLKPDWAKANDIRCGKTKAGVYLYSVLDIAKYVERVLAERTIDALESSVVQMWRFVADQASADDNAVAEKWANGHLMTAIADSDADIVDASALTLE